MSFRAGTLVLVIPPVFTISDGSVWLDGDFANNLRAYLDAFPHVHVMANAARDSDMFPNRIPWTDVPGHDRATLTVLPEPYREDRYLKHRRRVKALLRTVLAESEYRLISPHAAFDWPTLACELCFEMGIPYNMEADWALPMARAELLRTMPWGPNKLRKFAWGVYHDRKYYRALRRSSLSLLQGGEVYHHLGHIAPNAFSVLNVQITEADRISANELSAKLDRSADEPVKIVYAGRAAPMKGPHCWLEIIRRLKQSGARFHATWIGDGSELEAMRAFVERHGLGDVCALPGKLERAATRKLIGDADIFLFCHLLAESPRCLVEALAAGTPIIGFESHYARGLVGDTGGGMFVAQHDVEALAQMVTALVQDRAAIRDLTGRAATAGMNFDREAAIEERIRLMKTHLGGRKSA